MKFIITSMILIILGACAPSENSSSLNDGKIRIYKSREAIQCESSGIPPQESAQTLVDAGIDVISTLCGQMTNIAVIAVCGAGTTDILIHEVHKENLADAERLGYTSIEALANNQGVQGYQIIDC